MTAIKTTPMMAQWQECKQKAKGALLLFRLGDFYEAFYDDATRLSDLLDITLTKRQDIPMAGIPAHTIEQYLERLIAKKMVVAIAEQVEDPKVAKGIVRREITQIVSPATYIPTHIAPHIQNNFFASIAEVNATLGLSLIDLSTAELATMQLDNFDQLYDELIKKKPKELLISEKFAKNHGDLIAQIEKALDIRIALCENHAFNLEQSLHRLTKHFKTQNLDGFGLRGLTAAICSLGALFSYIRDELNLSLDSMTTVALLSLNHTMNVDHTTLRHLEIIESEHKDSHNTLLDLLDQTQTAMGARLFRSWITHPLIRIESITKRQQAIQELLDHPSLLYDLKRALHSIKDLQRLTIKIESKTIHPKELTAYQSSLQIIPLIKELIQTLQSPLIGQIDQSLCNTDTMTQLVKAAISDDPPVKLNQGGAIRDGYHPPLDELRSLKKSAQTYLSNYQIRLREELDIKTLRVSFNRAFGYYIEVSKAQSLRMPNTFEKRQTLVNAERFISQELKEFESKILNAESQIELLEETLYSSLLDTLKKHTQDITAISKGIARLDCLLSLALVAREHRYTCPIVDHSSILKIVDGRHPVIEKTLKDDSFIPNDTDLNESEKMMMITGPNMAGKSTYIRQVALIVLMAQMGSFVPATHAHIGVIKRLFTRIGASDDLSRGLSTFMVEMAETAGILNRKCEQSLIILDEIGRGTSTYDGIAIASSVAQFLISPLATAPKTLFATHYFELTELEKEFNGITNYRVAVKETENQVIFLRKIIKGAADKSYGIHVAQLAGVPLIVLQKAKQLLHHLEKNPKKEGPDKQIAHDESDDQLLLFAPLESSRKRALSLLEEIKQLDLDEISPREAHQFLIDYQTQLKGFL
ncbi:MAG: DNA mismatch repair protein MutS [Simkaniaceae bacterium]|nr:DNA mismatch repair protein MutS [Simkaniaceae bacterium]MCF7851676.1 DNA mismatch repair protein MutS [Simkaniaceae bacterium]